MGRILLGAALLAAIAASSSGAASERSAQPRTLLVTHSPIDQFAADGSWIAWSTSVSCRLSVHLFSAATGRETRIGAGGDPIDCGRYGELAVAGGRAMWTKLIGAGNTELDVGVYTAGATSPKARRVQVMAMIRPEYGEEPLVPPVAGRGATLVFYRHEDGIGGPATHAVERVVGARAKQIFRMQNPTALAVDRGRIAAARRVLVRGNACNCNFDPAWSPDGAKIAFISGEECCIDDTEKADVFVMNADGSGRTQITNDARPKLGVTWSPDGSRLAFGYYTSNFTPRVAIINADGSGRLDVATGSNPSWSPDGMKLAFEDDKGHIVVADADGSNLRQVATGREPAWSPDGGLIAYSYSASVLTIRPDGSDKREIGPGMTAPAWSPDGGSIAGTAYNGIHIEAANGSSGRFVPGTARGDADPSWSPDGLRIVFDSVRNDLVADGRGRPDLYLTDAAGGNLQPLSYTVPDEWYSAVQVRGSYGRLLASTLVFGQPLGVALDGRYEVILSRGAHNRSSRLRIQDARSGALLHSVSVPAAARDLYARSGHALFVVGKTVRLVDLRTGKAQRLVIASGPVVGVGIAGGRVFWAENDGTHGPIRSLPIPR
jgi:Tol biopolymer transport system component